MATTLQKGLEEDNHLVTIASDGLEGVEVAQLYEFDVVILDLMLPKLDGFEVVRQLRIKGYDVPIVMLTARDSTNDIVRGLDAGADDYLTKPFSLQELLARLRAAGRHRPARRVSWLEVDDLQLDPSARRVIRNGQEIELSNTEYRLLEFLVRRVGQVVTRAVLIEAVWGFDRVVEENTLDAFMYLLRQKVDKHRQHRLIHTMRGVGYCVRAAK